MPKVIVMEDRHWPGVLALYEQRFGAWNTARFAARRRWQCIDNPYASRQPAATFVGLVDDRVIGTLGTFPLAVRTPHGTELVRCSADLASIPDQPLLPLLLTHELEKHTCRFASGMSEAAQRLGRMIGDVLIPLSETGFCYPLRRAGRVQRALQRRLPRRLGWVANRWTARALAAATSLRNGTARRRPPAKPSDDRMVRLDSFGPAYDRLWQVFAAGFAYCLERSSEYMRWRYLEGPAQKIETWALQRGDGELDGVLVIGERTLLDAESRPCGTIGEILELILRDATDRDDLETLLATAVNRLDRRGVDDVTATGLCKRYHATMQDFGFAVQSGGPFRISVHFDPERHPPAALQRDDAWYLSAADGDQLYTALL